MSYSYLEYQPEMDKDNEFVLNPSVSNEETNKTGKLYAHMRLTGKSKNRRLSLANLLERGLKSAPMGAQKLSRPEMKELQKYIEENF